MTKQYFKNPQGKFNYGFLTNASKGWNMLLGDKTERSISRQTAHGFKNTFNCPGLDDEFVEHMVHLSMGFSASLICSKNRNLQIGGIALLLGLVLLYLNGRTNFNNSFDPTNQLSHIKLQ